MIFNVLRDIKDVITQSALLLSPIACIFRKISAEITCMAFDMLWENEFEACLCFLDYPWRKFAEKCYSDASGEFSLDRIKHSDFHILLYFYISLRWHNKKSCPFEKCRIEVVRLFTVSIQLKEM